MREEFCNKWILYKENPTNEFLNDSEQEQSIKISKSKEKQMVNKLMKIFT